MHRATFRFYAELGDFMPPQRRGVAFEQAFFGAPAVKDLIEALGVPHPEVDLVVANGEPVTFAWQVSEGARVSVYPEFQALDVGAESLVRAPRPRPTVFVLDVHLGRLARYLRAAGFDVEWRADAADEALARESRESARILLTRDVGLLKRGEVLHGYWVRATDATPQLSEVLRRFGLARRAAPFTRCLECNTLLHRVAKSEVADQLPPRVRERHDDLRRCPTCLRVYWRGTHWARMATVLEQALR